MLMGSDTQRRRMNNWKRSAVTYLKCFSVVTLNSRNRAAELFAFGIRAGLDLSRAV